MAETPRGGRPQNLILEERKRLSVSGVEEVLGFDDSYVRMRTSLGELIAHGEDMRVESLSGETGEAVVTGQISELTYEESSRSAGLLSRLFKSDGNRGV